jgi:hypothetical protein
MVAGVVVGMRREDGEMKAPAKALVIVLAALGALPLLAWTGTHLYWRVRILGAIRVLQDQSLRDGGDASQVLHGAGCRALPYLIASLADSKDRSYLQTATYQITLDVTSPGWGHGLLPPEALAQIDVWVVDREDTEEEVERRIQAIRTYWRENGHKHHQWWRVWSANCAAREEES